MKEGDVVEFFKFGLFEKAIGVRPTQLIIKQYALQKFRPSYDLFQNLH